MTKNRNAGLDLLRLICMMMVVSMHYFGWGGVNGADNVTVINFAISGGLSVFSRVAVDCFFMLSGFLVSFPKVEYDWERAGIRIGKIWCKVLLYSFGITTVFSLLHLLPVDGKSLAYSAMPIMTNQYWFITIFLLLTAIRPLMSRGLTALTDKELLILSVGLVFFDCVQPLMGHNACHEFGAGFLNAFTCLVLGYTAKTLSFFQKGKWRWLFGYFALCCLAGVFAFAEKRYLHHEDAVTVMYNSPFIMLGALSLVCFFRSLRFSSKIITGIAPYVLGIYLINDHPLMREYCWENVLHCSTYYGSNLMVFHYLATVLGFVVVGIAIDYAVSRFLEFVSRHRLQY